MVLKKLNKSIALILTAVMIGLPVMNTAYAVEGDTTTPIVEESTTEPTLGEDTTTPEEENITIEEMEKAALESYTPYILQEGDTDKYYYDLDTGLPLNNYPTIQPMLGGGPSPSAAWTVYSTSTRTLNKSQIIALNDRAENAQSSGKTSQTAYSLSLVIAGYMSYGIPTFATFLGFQSTYGTLISTTLNTVRLALVHMDKTGRTSVKVKFTTYYRPASGQKITVATGIIK